MPQPPVEDIRRALHDVGYYITEPIFSRPAMARLQEAIEARWRAAVADAEAKGNPVAIEMVKTRAYLIQNHRQGQIFRDLLGDPWYMALSRELVGPDVDLTWSQAIVKPGRVGRTLDWHQDGQYAITEPLESGFTILLAVTDMTLDNGAVWVLPGRHREGLLPHEWSPATNEWQGRYDTSARVPAVMQAGQMLVFGRFLPHFSGPNTSDAIRISFQIGYGGTDIRLAATGSPFGDRTPVLRGGMPVPIAAM